MKFLGYLLNLSEQPKTLQLECDSPIFISTLQVLDEIVEVFPVFVGDEEIELDPLPLDDDSQGCSQ